MLRWGSAALSAGTLLAACSPVGPPQTFRFATNHDSAAAVRCASERLRIEGFLLSDAEMGPVGLRLAETSTAGREWWRVALSITRDDEGRTVVQSLAGVGPTEQGPFTEPTVELQGIVGKISASCTW